ncbi:hypothetical protein [Clostridium senegalense]|uniref:hypothetical protein n=1 Tax=Clostridium senegalense TaxID=1465809 RepID=UPI0003139203|nr:hypothetical protein [Clostridium senegalense]
MMINVFCNEKGSGKTKALVNLANEKACKAKGNIVYIDDDNKMLFQLDRNIRFVCAEDFKLKTAKEIEGFLCGIVSQDYDVEYVMVDGIMKKVDIEEMPKLFDKIKYLVDNHNIKFYINISGNSEELPKEVRKYVVEKQ